MLQNKYFWAGVSISTMWLAVIFVGIFGPSLTTGGVTSETSLPLSAIVVATFAMIGTIVVAVFGFRK
jgi:hypothetical protein